MPIDYNLPLWRPPSEGSNLIIQVTIGCSYNHCSFCSMYTEKQFRVRSFREICHDIDTGAREWPKTRRVFLADGDAMMLPVDYLCEVLNYIRFRFPELTRVSSYATPDNINRKSSQELTDLKSHGLSLVYLGIESGNVDVLKRVTKGASPKGIINAIRSATAAGLTTSCMVILGLGGKEYSERHIIATAELVNIAPPAYLSTLQLDIGRAERANFFARWEEHGSHFQQLSDSECLEEMATLISVINPPKPIIFRSNHASNILPLEGILSKDRENILSAIAKARQFGLGLRSYPKY